MLGIARLLAGAIAFFLVLGGAWLGGAWLAVTLALALTILSFAWLAVLLGTRFRVEVARWFFVLEIGKAMLYVRWLNEDTATSYNKLREREGVPPLN